jgi:predicted PurR-regulated permease PerM
MDKARTWSKEARYLALVGILLGLVGMVWFFWGIITPLILAAIFAYILHPAVEFLDSRTRLKTPIAVVVVYVTSLLLLVALLALTMPLLVNQIRAIELDLESLADLYAQFITTPYSILGTTILPEQFLPPLPAFSTDLLTPLVENLLSFMAALTKNFIGVLVVMVSLYYFLQDGYKIQGAILRIAPNAYRSDVHHLYEQLRHVWSDYLRSQLVFMFVVGLVDSIVWLAVGLPGAVVLGFMTGITSFVHEIGALVSGVLSVLAALIGGSSIFRISNFWFAVLVFILYMVLTGVKNIWLRPVIIGRHVHMHAGIVFVVVVAALIFHGPLSAFLVVPVLVSLMVIGRYLRRRILGLPPFPPGQDPSSYFRMSATEGTPEETIKGK